MKKKFDKKFLELLVDDAFDSAVVEKVEDKSISCIDDIWVMIFHTLKDNKYWRFYFSYNNPSRFTDEAEEVLPSKKEIVQTEWISVDEAKKSKKKTAKS